MATQLACPPAAGRCQLRLQPWGTRRPTAPASKPFSALHWSPALGRAPTRWSGQSEQASTTPAPEGDAAGSMPLPAAGAPAQAAPKRRLKAESTDPVASFMTRRFGIVGGAAWIAVLAIGSLGEQVKTRMEQATEESNTKDVSSADIKEVVTPSGLRYSDLRVGGGQAPYKGCLVILDYVGRANGVVFEDTKKRGKPIVLLYGSRPFTGGMCKGTEEALATMRAGGKRRVVVPAALGFGPSGAVLRPTEHVPEKAGIIPPDAELEYELDLIRVSITPS